MTGFKIVVGPVTLTENVPRRKKEMFEATCEVLVTQDRRVVVEVR